MNSNEDAHIYYSEVLRYGYPIFIRNFYDKDFETLDGIGLTRITPENQEICQKILWSCKTLGWIEYIEENKIKSVFGNNKKIGSAAWWRTRARSAQLVHLLHGL